MRLKFQLERQRERQTNDVIIASGALANTHAQIEAVEIRLRDLEAKTPAELNVALKV